MELRQLEYFMITCEKGSFNQAAECLYTTQPNVSKVISSLEKELGENFARCHRSCLVNRRQVVSVDKKKRELLMADHTVLQCSYRSLRFFA